MEHLFFDPSVEELDSKAEWIINTSELDCDWDAVPGLTSDITCRKYPWLGFDAQGKPKWAPDTIFWSHYETRSWNMRNVIFGDWRAAHPSLKDPEVPSAIVEQRVLQMLQCCCTIGFLEDVVQTGIQINYLTRVNELGDRIFDTRNLTFLLRSVVNRRTWTVKHKEIFTYPQWLKWILFIHARFFNNIEMQISRRYASSSTNDPAQMSIAGMVHSFKRVTSLVHEAVSAVYNFLCNPSLPSKVISPGDTPFGLEGLKASEFGLLHAGFCPHFAKFALLGGSTLCEWLAWWGSRWDAASVDDHTSCTMEHCVLENVPDRGLQHISTCCGNDCTLVRPPIEEVNEALDAGAIPLMRIKSLESGQSPSLVVVPTRDLVSRNYVALSHVWRHGRGSTSEVGLYACQYEDLWRGLKGCSLSTSEIDSMSVAFWMDSLCIPANPARRKAAISNINRVFTQANQVLVVDASVQLMSQQSNTIEDILATILCSAWQTRLWTYMEAYCAHKLTFLLKDGVCPIRNDGQICIPSQPSPLPRLPDIVRGQLLMLSTYLESSLSSGATLSSKYYNAVGGMRDRTTTKSSDEALILGAIFDLNTKSIASQEGEERMHVFYQELHSIPLLCIFAGYPPLSIANHGWAPRTLQFDRATISLEQIEFEGYGTYSYSGLKCNLPAFLLDKSHDRPRNTHIIVGKIAHAPGTAPEPTPSRDTATEYVSAMEAAHFRINPARGGSWWVANSGYNVVIPKQPLEESRYDQLYPALLAKVIERRGDSEFMEAHITCRIVATVILSFTTVNFADPAGKAGDGPDFDCKYSQSLELVLI